MNVKDEARHKLIRQLQGACSGELAAGFAYRGHAQSVADPAERDRIRIIESEEWHHRALVRQLLSQLDAGPDFIREAIFWVIGKAIGLFCQIGGWFAPMYGAGKLERSNIVEYELAAKFAVECGRDEMVDCLLTMAEVEWDHERFFRERVEGHRFLRLFPLWNTPPPRAFIRSNHTEWQSRQGVNHSSALLNAEGQLQTESRG